MIPDLLDRERHAGIQRVQLDHGREQREPFDVAVELARQQQRALQGRRSASVMLLGRNQDALHGMSLLLRTRLIRASAPRSTRSRAARCYTGGDEGAKTEYISRNCPKPRCPSRRPGPQPGRWVLSHGEIRTIVFGLMLAMFLAALNQTIVATALPTIGRDFRDFELLPWVVTAYLLSSTVVAPLYGKLSDISRAPRHDAGGRRHLHRRFRRLCPGARHDHADPRTRACRGSAGAAFCRWRNPFLPMRSRRASAAATRPIWVASG